MTINWVILTFGQGSLNTGFPHVTLEIRKPEGDTVKISGGLPDAPQVLEFYRRWQQFYSGYYERLGWSFRIEIDEGDLTNVAVQDLPQIGLKLKNEINTWLNSNLFKPIEKTLRTQLSPDDKIGFIIETNQEQIQRLPWNFWEFFEDYPHAIHAFSPSSYFPKKQKRNKFPRTKVKILAILGQSQGLDLTKDVQSLKQIHDSTPEFLTQPKSEDLNDELWKIGWDILFFAGHSKTNKQGVIYLNEEETLTVNQIKYAVSKAIMRGLKLAIFNSCDGLGLARDLTELQLPVVIVMREPVPDEVAQVFLNHFVNAYAQEESVLMAVLEARQRLEKLELKYPYAAGLPTIFLNPSVPVPTWQDLGRIVEPDFSPYQGLLTFQIKDAPFFFGRENFTKQLVEAVERQPLVVITGSSGSGKSSVVFAGLIPQLHRLEKWYDISFRPGDRPLMALAGTLIQILEPQLSQSERIPKIRALAQHLWKFPDGLRDIFDEIFKKYPDQTLLLIIDQFEELYSLCQNRKEQNVFIDRLLKIVNLKINLRIVITIRADFLEQAYSHRKFTDALQYLGTHILGPMCSELQT
ncbi:nSTAND1 domain-containing NTPase [Planktothrix mougeotii]|uniref:CHAT domain-containing protein n=1 Tax=Planktothrix mougeotii LEGE 06226 TaxID=1828728 RepID=A0ABR9UJF7_9CYAN|nr:CHAT domain-containing protein [Planktothrix mougeotii]MBE9146585.1 CHAT domain-containing protein [Planktothrix mougeotii LEGE 06226]